VTWTPRLIQPGEFDAVADLLATAFGSGPKAPPDHRAEIVAMAELDRIFVVEDEGRFVGTAAALSVDLALPGGSVGMAGVTEVSVLPTHRRRGLLSALIEAVHDQAVERGEPLAGLTASEGGIYRRFGYGVASHFQLVRIDAHRTAEALAVEGTGTSAGDQGGSGGRIRLVSEDEATAILPAVWDRHRRRVPGEIHRTPGLWAVEALDNEHVRGGASARYVAVHDDEGGRPDGFVTYRIAQGWGDGGPNHEVRVQTLAAASDGAEAELVRFLFDIDLVGTVIWHAPVDMPLRWRLADPRALTVRAEADHLWLRPLDVATCLAARSYATEGELVLGVVDRRRDGGGGYRLEAGPHGARCERTDAAPDLVLDTAEVGSVLAGGATWRTLARAGRIAERTPGAVDRADALFRPERAPFCGTEF
jgi:predicted acetyltransferase